MDEEEPKSSAGSKKAGSSARQVVDKKQSPALSGSDSPDNKKGSASGDGADAVGGAIRFARRSYANKKTVPELKSIINKAGISMAGIQGNAKKADLVKLVVDNAGNIPADFNTPDAINRLLNN